MQQKGSDGRDGVHLSDVGYDMYIDSLRAAISNICRPNFGGYISFRATGRKYIVAENSSGQESSGCSSLCKCNYTAVTSPVPRFSAKQH